MKYYYAFLVILLLLTNCAKEQPEASWLIVEPWTLNKNNLAQHDAGELTHAVTEAFISMDGKMLGAFELPAKIPVIEEGTHELILVPGIVNNGISATKRRYPFMKNYEDSITLIAGDTVAMAPETEYFKDIKFLIEDFENASLQFDYSNESNTQITKGDNPEYLEWGNNYGAIELNNSDSLLSAITTFGEVLPKQGAEVFLEMDFINTNSMLTGVVSYGNNTFHEDPNIQLNPQENPVWKHIYIDLREIISFRNSSPINEMSFTAILDEIDTEKFVYLDNIKVVYR